MKRILGMLCVMAISSTAMADYFTDFEGWVTGDLDTMPGWSREATVANVIIGDTPNLGSNLTDRVQISYGAFAWFEPGEADQFAHGILEFDVMMNGGAPGWPNLILYLSNDDAPVKGVWLRIASETGAGGDDLDLFVYDPGVSSGTVELTDFMTRDVWYNLKIEFNATNETYDVSLDDALVLDDEPAWGAFGEVNRIAWQNSVGYYTQIDNVSLVAGVPGPITPLEVDLDPAVEISFPPTIGFVYQPQYTEDLITSNTWLNLGSSIAGNGGIKSAFDTTQNALFRAYRVLEQQ